jgi:hypothetical protein
MRVLSSYRGIGISMPALLLAFAIGGFARAGIVNGSFESGLTGWTTNGGVLTAVVGSHSAVLDSPATTFSPIDGTKFATVGSGLQNSAGENVYTVLTQTFTAAAGDTLVLHAFFDSGDSLTVPFFNFANDDGYVRLLNSSNVEVAMLFKKSVADLVSIADPFGNNSTPWTPLSHVFVAGGTYMLEVGVINRPTLPQDVFTDNAAASYIGIDNVHIIPVPVVIPTPAAAWGGLALLGLAWPLRRRLLGR